MTPAVAFGMTLHNNARHLPEAIDSLLAQSDPDFGLLLLDDGSSDATPEIARAYAARDSRIRFERHPARQGMVQSWRSAVDLALGHFSGARYFAWASDHDRWHLNWLRLTRAELDAHPEAVLAYPRTRRIDEAGTLWEKQPKTFDTVGIRAADERWLRFSGEAVGAGDLVYGLMRIDSLRRAGIFRSVMLPDRLLMLELTLQGEFRQVQADLWFRRQGAASSLVRQRVSLFTPENAPAGLSWPPRFQHARVLRREYVWTVRPEIDPRVMRGLIWRYLVLDVWRQYSKSTALIHRIDNRREAIVDVWKGLRRRVWTSWYEGGVALAAWRGRMRRRGRRSSRVVPVFRRRMRAAGYESRVATVKVLVRARRAARRGLHNALVFTHRLGLRGRS
jgi:glycosyltransferase involved in cell wall biosynthesis